MAHSQTVKPLNGDLGNRLIMASTGWTALQSKNENTLRRLQVEFDNDNIDFFKSTDGGLTWPSVKRLITNAEINIFNTSCVDMFFDTANNWPVLKWRINPKLEYQMVITQNGISVDRFDGTQWINMYQLTK